MHPILGSPRRLLLYLAAWSLPGALLGTVLGFSGDLSWKEALALAVPLSLLYAAFCLSPWYLCRAFPLNEGRLPKALLNHLVAALISSAIWTKAAQGVALAWSAVFPGIMRRLQGHLGLLAVTGLLIYLLAVALHYVYLAIESSEEARRREQQARLLAQEAELKALKAQINPHFLFNCLNSISALTSSDPRQAREMCIRLSDFLRNTLRLGDKQSVSFADEMALVNTYLAVEEVRFGARLRVEREIEAGCQRCAVPPLLFQPLIENCVKHGVAGLVDGGTIYLRASCGDGILRVSVENDFDPDSPAQRKTGLGLANVRNRVAARHGNRGRVDVTVGGNRHRVDVSIPCEAVS